MQSTAFSLFNAWKQGHFPTKTGDHCAKTANYHVGLGTWMISPKPNNREKTGSRPGVRPRPAAFGGGREWAALRRARSVAQSDGADLGQVFGARAAVIEETMSGVARILASGC